MVPRNSAAGVLSGITGPGGANVAFTVDIIKGVQYAFFSAVTGTYTATYSADTTRPTITSTSPVNGTGGVAQGTTVTATFSEPMDPTTITTATVELRDPASAIVPASVSYNTSNRTATLTPTSPLLSGTAYNAKVTTGVKDLAGNALAADQTWSFTTGSGPTCPCSAWNSSATPADPNFNDPNSVEVGVKFRVDLNGFITGIDITRELRIPALIPEACGVLRGKCLRPQRS